MSIVEKAIERLRLQQEQADPEKLDSEPRIERPEDSPTGTSTIARLAAEGVRQEPSAPDVDTKPLVIEWNRLREAGYVASEDLESRLKDELRHIKRRLLAGFGRGRDLGKGSADWIMITSATMGEGKTFTSINLALSLAQERDLDVLLVDADVPKSDITRLFQLEQARGLTDALTDDGSDPESLVLSTDISNLKVLPAGRYHEHTAELLNSARMNRVVRMLGEKGRRRILLFDSPPLLMTADAPVLASHMGQVLIVVAADRTPQQVVRTAIDALDDQSTVSLILNMANLPGAEKYYYGYYRRTDKDR